eukprot:4338851-Amphidinium_carterae.1
MSLEDSSLVDIMKETKDMKNAIVDEHYIEYMLHRRGLGQEDYDELKQKKVAEVTRDHLRDVSGPILRRNAILAQRRRDDGPDGVPADEAVPPTPDLPKDYDAFTAEERKHVNDFTEAFNHYSRVLLYTLTKITKGEVCRLVVQCNQNNSSGFETWRRLHITYDQGEKAQNLAQLKRIMNP